MKKLLMTGCAVLALSASANAHASKQDEVQGAKATCVVADPDDALNVRTQPNGTIVATLQTGTTIGVLDRKGKWVFIRGFSDNTYDVSGWVYTKYLVRCKPIEEECGQ